MRWNTKFLVFSLLQNFTAAWPKKVLNNLAKKVPCPHSLIGLKQLGMCLDVLFCWLFGPILNRIKNDEKLHNVTVSYHHCFHLSFLYIRLQVILLYVFFVIAAAPHPRLTSALSRGNSYEDSLLLTKHHDARTQILQHKEIT